MKKKEILYITYDGLLDKLGQSQILPYLDKLKNKYSINILSFEKKINFHLFDSTSIYETFNWKFKYFTKSNFKIIKLLDYFSLFINAFLIINRSKINICHCRGFIPALVIYFLSFFIRIKYIYDMRGFWPEERIDNKQLNYNKQIDYLIYLILKIIEKRIILNSNHIVVLTKEAKKIIYLLNDNITVIPCATDFDNFANPKLIKKTSSNNSLITQISENNKIYCYLGSLGGAYLYEQMLRYFKLIKLQNKKVYFFTVTNDIEIAKKTLSKPQFKTIFNNVKILFLNREEVPFLLCNSHAMIAFIKNSYARKAMSPVKVSEALASNLPIIINQNIGDVDDHLRQFNIGISIDIHNLESIKKSIYKVDKLTNKLYSRDKAFNIYDINKAVVKYSKIYSKI